MTCQSPILVGDELKSVVRCGRCMPCKIRRKQSWVGRLILERADHVSARFLTLTYAKEEDQQSPLVYEHVQLFLKRYRYYYGPFRFYAVGEYGDKSGNAHWHLIIFGHEQQAQGHLLDFKPWPYGFAFDGSVTVHSIGYVAKYATKQLPSGRRPVSEMSRRPGIGLGRIAKLAVSLAAGLHGERLGSWPGRLSIAGKRYPLSEGGLECFKTAFLDAGGFAPLSLTPEDRHTVAMEAWADLGSQRLGREAFARSFFHSRGAYGLQVPSEKV